MSTFVLAALKGQQLLKQWVIEAAGSPETLAIQYWPQAKAMGASRLCAASSGNAWFACYDGNKLTPQKLSLSVPAPPAPKCPPGQAFNAQGKCVPVGQQQQPPPQPSWPCPTGAQIQAFAASKSLTWFVTSVPPSAAPTNAKWTQNSRVYSNSDRSFYAWNTGAWVKDVALTNELLAVCGPKKLTASGSSAAKCQPGYHYDAHVRRCIPNFSLLAGVKTKQFIGEVKWLGEPISNVATAKSQLIEWSKSVDAKNLSKKIPFDDYGSNPIDQPLTEWKCRDSRMLTSFSEWWGPKHPGKLATAASFDVPGCEPFWATPLDQSHVDALKEWATGSSWASKCPPGTVLMNNVCMPDPNWAPALVVCPAGQFYNSTTSKCEPISSIPVTKVETPQAPPAPQQKTQPQTQQPGGGQPPATTTTPTAPTAPAKKSSSTGLLVLGAIGVAVVGAVAVMARKKSEEAA